jgi:hypothetical protein
MKQFIKELGILFLIAGGMIVAYVLVVIFGQFILKS